MEENNIQEDTIITTSKYALWTQLFKQWLSQKFNSISIDLTPVEEKLDDVAQEATLTQGVEYIREDISHIDIDTSTLAKQGDNHAATNSAILEALSHISPEDPYSQALAQFFGVTLLEGYEFMQDTEVCDELEDIMQLVDPDLTAAQAADITAQTLNPSES